MGGQQQVIVSIAKRVGQHRLFCLAHPVHRFSDFGEVHLTTTQKRSEIKHYRLDPIIARRRVERANEITCTVFFDRGTAGKQRSDGVNGRFFLNHHPAKLDQQRAIAHLAGAGTGREDAKQRDKEQQHEHEDKSVLDPDENLPHFADKAHSIVPFFTLGCYLGADVGNFHGKAPQEWVEQRTTLD